MTSSTTSSHPLASLLPAVISSSSSNRTRAHPASYHSFVDSPFPPPTATATASSSSKKKSTASTSILPPLLKERAAIPARVLHHNLLTWFDAVRDKRRMPWRKDLVIDHMSSSEKTQRAYEVWVSEIMLQQTQVATVIPYFNRWLDQFPTVAALAEADIEKVNECWKGLGYYSRASRLLAGARTVMRDFKGKVPSTVEGLEHIDGIGPYSAGAISSIAFGRRSAMVDGNVTRVLSRLTAFHAPSTAKSTTTFIWALAAILVPPQSSSLPEGYAPLDVGGPNKSGSWNQALMELGATVCTPKQPKCGECPLKTECAAYAEVHFAKSNLRATAASQVNDIEELCTLCSPIEGFSPRSHDVTQYPMAKERKKQREEDTAVCVLEWQPENENGKREVLLCKRPEKGLLAGLFEFPSIDLPPSSTESTSASRRKLLHRLVQSLITDPLPLASSRPSSITILDTEDLPPTTQVYSHMIRTYHPTRLVLGSIDRPKLVTSEPKRPILSKKKRKNSSHVSDEEEEADEEALVQSIPGRAQWFVESDVAGANTGGAVDKVWAMRQRVAKGLKAAEEGKGKKGGGAKQKEAARKAGIGEKQQGLMRDWLGGATVKNQGKVGQEKEGEEVVLVMEESPSRAYKKRRIIIPSDEEEEA